MVAKTNFQNQKKKSDNFNFANFDAVKITVASP
jgi:hypothetical protein